MYKVEDHKSLVRDSANKAILNIDREKLSEHRNKRQMKNNIEELNEEIASLKNDFQEIKLLLQQIVNRG